MMGGLLGILASPAALLVLGLAVLAWRRTSAPVLNMHFVSAARRSLPFDREAAALMGDAPLGSDLFLWRVHKRLAAGWPLHEALRMWLSRFPEGYLAAVEAGEGTAALPRVLEEQDAALNRWSDLSLRFVGAMFYPVFLSWFLIQATVFLRLFILPRFAAMFEDMGLGADVAAKFLLVRTCSQAAIWFIFVVILAGALLLLAPRFAASLGARVLMLLGMGHAVAAAGLSEFCEQFGILLRSGVPQKEAFAAASKAVWLGPLRPRIRKARALWEGGVAFPDAIAEAVGMPGWMETLLRYGEGSGKLAETLEECAGIARQKTAALREGALKLLTPALVAVMGTLVGVTVWAMFSTLTDLIMGFEAL